MASSLFGTSPQSPGISPSTAASGIGINSPIDVVGKPAEEHHQGRDEKATANDMDHDVALGLALKASGSPASTELHAKKASKRSWMRWVLGGLFLVVVSMFAGVVGAAIFELLLDDDDNDIDQGSGILDETEAETLPTTLSGALAFSIGLGDGSNSGDTEGGLPELFLQDDSSVESVAASIARNLPWSADASDIAVVLTTSLPSISTSARRMAEMAAPSFLRGHRSQSLPVEQPSPRRLQEVGLVYAQYEVDVSTASSQEIAEADEILSGIDADEWESTLNEELDSRDSDFLLEVLAVSTAASSTATSGGIGRGGRDRGQGRGRSRGGRNGVAKVDDMCQSLFGTDEELCSMAGNSSCTWVGISRNASLCVASEPQDECFVQHGQDQQGCEAQWGCSWVFLLDGQNRSSRGGPRGSRGSGNSTGTRRRHSRGHSGNRDGDADDETDESSSGRSGGRRREGSRGNSTSSTSNSRGRNRGEGNATDADSNVTRGGGGGDRSNRSRALSEGSEEDHFDVLGDGTSSAAGAAGRSLARQGSGMCLRLASQYSTRGGGRSSRGEDGDGRSGGRSGGRRRGGRGGDEDNEDSNSDGRGGGQGGRGNDSQDNGSGSNSNGRRRGGGHGSSDDSDDTRSGNSSGRRHGGRGGGGRSGNGTRGSRSGVNACRLLWTEQTPCDLTPFCSWNSTLESCEILGRSRNSSRSQDACNASFANVSSCSGVVDGLCSWNSSTSTCQVDTEEVSNVATSFVESQSDLCSSLFSEERSCLRFGNSTCAWADESCSFNTTTAATVSNYRAEGVEVLVASLLGGRHGGRHSNRNSSSNSSSNNTRSGGGRH